MAIPDVRLRELLPGVDFQQAISVIQQIAEKTEDRAMYDQREKAERDRLWQLDGAREQGLREGIEQGIERGIERGIEMGLIVGKIHALQQILDEEPAPVDQLRRLSSDERSRLLGDLQERVRSRR